MPAIPSAAERLWRRAYQALDGLGEKGNLSTIAAYLAEAVYAQGRYDEAEELTAISESLTSRGRRHVAHRLACRAREGRGAAWRWRSRRGACARRRSSAAAETDWPHLRGGAFEALADVLMAAGQADDAALAARQALELYEAKGSVAAADAATRPRRYSSRRAMAGSAPAPRVAGGTTSVIPGRRLAHRRGSASGTRVDDRLRDRIGRRLVADHLVIGGVVLRQVVDRARAGATSPAAPGAPVAR